MYLPIKRQLSPGDVIRLHMEMPVQVLQANPQVADDAGRVAVQRGPVVYCMEEFDQPAGVTMSDLAVDLGQKPQADFQYEMKKDLLGGVRRSASRSEQNLLARRPFVRLRLLLFAWPVPHSVLPLPASRSQSSTTRP